MLQEIICFDITISIDCGEKTNINTGEIVEIVENNIWDK